MAAEAVLTFAAEGILEKVLSLAEKQFSLAWGFKAELRKLRESFTTIKLLLNDVAHKPQAPPIEEWVKKLKNVAHDAEDFFDELEYEGYRRKVEIHNHMKKKVLNFFSLSNPLAFRLKSVLEAHIVVLLLWLIKKCSVMFDLVTITTQAASGGIGSFEQLQLNAGMPFTTFRIIAVMMYDIEPWNCFIFSVFRIMWVIFSWRIV